MHPKSRGLSFRSWASLMGNYHIITFMSEEPKPNFTAEIFIWGLGTLLHACTINTHTHIHIPHTHTHTHTHTCTHTGWEVSHMTNVQECIKVGEVYWHYKNMPQLWLDLRKGTISQILAIFIVWTAVTFVVVLSVSLHIVFLYIPSPMSVTTCTPVYISLNWVIVLSWFLFMIGDVWRSMLYSSWLELRYYSEKYVHVLHWYIGGWPSL